MQWLQKNPIPPTMWSYNDEVVDLSFDLEKAKSYLKKSSFDTSKELELWTLPVSRPYNPNGKKMGELIQADLAKIGVKIKLITYDWPTYLEKSRKGEHDLIQFGWTGDNGDPDNFLNVLLSCKAKNEGSNVSKFCYKPFDDLIIKAKQTFDMVERTALYKKAQLEFKKQVPWAPIAHATAFRAMRSNVSGYVLNPLGTENFYGVHFK